MRKYEQFTGINQSYLRQTGNVRKLRNKYKVKLYIVRYIAKLWLEIMIGF